MAKVTGFMEYKRKDPSKRPVVERITDYKEFEQLLPHKELILQAARCMDCGIPFCHSYGCPVGNRIPDWNDLVYRDQWQRALEVLHSTDNFPEITGRVCPAPCEMACTLGINEPPVSIRHIELQIVEKGWEQGWIKPQPAAWQSNKTVAVVGSGPSGLSAAQQLARKGHKVIVFEKADRIGGLLRYGIPDFKLEKWVIDRRLEQLKAEGVTFETDVNVGVDLSVRYLRRSFDAILITAGATVPRDLDIPGRKLEGIHYAMDFLAQQNKRVADYDVSKEYQYSARDKNVVVIGGGDTGSDCVGTSRRQGAKSITQIEILPKPPKQRILANPWPTWPNIFRTSSSHEEGCERMWSILSEAFTGKNRVQAVKVVRLKWSDPGEKGKQTFERLAGSEFELPADLVLLAAGFVHVEHGPMVTEAGLKLDGRGNIMVDEQYMTSVKGIFAAGDAVMGASLVVRAFFQGREAASSIDRYLVKTSE
ncbi:glutamate synthase subunit beta [candidate division KSB1 bacterium]|nr:glutamate synthase subunit beta [candidate division KSB1 bacterium]